MSDENMELEVEPIIESLDIDIPEDFVIEDDTIEEVELMLDPETILDEYENIEPEDREAYKLEINKLLNSRKVSSVKESFEFVMQSLNELLNDVSETVEGLGFSSELLQDVKRKLYAYISKEKPKCLPDSLIPGFAKYNLGEPNFSPEECIKLPEIAIHIKSDIEGIHVKSFLAGWARFARQIKRTVEKNYSFSMSYEKRLKLSYLKNETIAYNNKNNISLDKSVFVESIELLENGKCNYECGHCHSIISENNSFFDVFIKLSQHESEKIISVAPLQNTCPDCGHTNFLTKLEYRKLISKLKELYRPKALHFNRTYKDKEVSDVAISINRYFPPSDIIIGLIPTVFHKTAIIPVVTENIVENVDIDEAYRKYKSKIQAFRRKRSLNSSKFSDNLLTLNKSICPLVGINYATLKRQSINTLIMFIYDNSILYSILSNKSIYRLKGIIASSEILDSYQNMEPTELEDIVSRIVKDIEYSEDYILFNDAKELNVEVLKPIIKEFKCYINKREEELEEQYLIREHSITRLQAVKEEFSFIPISMLESLEDGIKEALLDDERIINFILETSELMILNHIAEQFSEYWFNSILKDVKYLLKVILSEISSQDKVATSIETLCKIMDKSYADSSYTSSDKFLSYIEKFSLYKSFNVDDTFVFNKLKEYLVSIDIFNFNLSMSELPGNIGSQYTKNSVEDILMNTISCKQFIEKHGSDRYSRIRYITGEQFSLKEIRSSNLPVTNYNFDRLLIRKKGEDFASYIDRMYQTDFTVVKTEELLTSFIFDSRDLYYRAVDVIASTLPYRYLLSNTEKYNTFLFVRDFLNICRGININKALAALDLDKDLICLSGVTDDTQEFISTRGIRKNQIDNLLANLYYPIEEYNNILVFNDKSIKALPSITSNREEFIESISFLPASLRSEIIEYYSI